VDSRKEAGIRPEVSRAEDWLRYFSDLGFSETYRDRSFSSSISAVDAGLNSRGNEHTRETEPAISASLPAAPKSSALARSDPPVPLPIVRAFSPTSLFDEADRVANDSMGKIRETIGDCIRCRLHKGRNKIVFGVGDHKAELVFVGEGPGRDEDLQGEPFVGRAGKLLTQMIEAMGLRREKVYICNVVKCRPPENRTPEKDEMAMCSQFLLRQLGVIKPKAIVCLGNVAAQALLGPAIGVSRARGQWFDFAGARLMPTYHPAYLLRNPAAKSIVWADLQLVMGFLGLPLPRSAKRAQPRT
jgi:uracil-DNA glycosylase family 4